MNFVFVFSLTNCSMLDCTCQQIFPFEVLPKKEDEIKKADKTRASRVKVLLSLSLPRSFSITYSVILHLSRLVACAMQTITITITFADTSSSHTIKTKYLCATPALAIVQFSWAAHSSVGLSGSLSRLTSSLSLVRSLALCFCLRRTCGGPFENQATNTCTRRMPAKFLVCCLKLTRDFENNMWFGFFMTRLCVCVCEYAWLSMCAVESWQFFKWGYMH